MRMTEKTRFTIVAISSAVAAATITAVIDRFAMQQDLEFLGIVHKQVQEGVSQLKGEIEGEGDGDVNS